jgi:hypothetical protein
MSNTSCPDLGVRLAHLAIGLNEAAGAADARDRFALLSERIDSGLRAISAFEDTVRVRDTKQVRPHFHRHLIVAGMRKRFIL